MVTFNEKRPHTTIPRPPLTGAAFAEHPWQKAGYSESPAAVPRYFSWMGSRQPQPSELVYTQSLNRIRPYSATPKERWDSLSPAREYKGTVGLPHTHSSKTISHTFLNPSSSCVRGPRTNRWPNRSSRELEAAYERQFGLFNAKAREEEARIRRAGKPLTWSAQELQRQIQDKIRQHTSGKLGISLEAFKLFCNDPEADAGNIDFSQFHETLNRMLNTQIRYEDAKGLFDRYDLDGGGSISLSELVIGFDSDRPTDWVDTSGLPDSDTVVPSDPGPKFRRVESVANWSPPKSWRTPTKREKEPCKVKFEGTVLEKGERAHHQEHVVEQEVQRYRKEIEEPEQPKPRARPKSAAICRQMERMQLGRELTLNEKARARRVIPVAPSPFSRY